MYIGVHYPRQGSTVQNFGTDGMGCTKIQQGKGMQHESRGFTKANSSAKYRGSHLQHFRLVVLDARELKEYRAFDKTCLYFLPRMEIEIENRNISKSFPIFESESESK
jgi:hypothetical protein